MNEIKKWFDDFTLHARVMPVLTGLLPIFILIIDKSVVAKDIETCTVYSFLTIILLSFSSRISREKGKKLERNMYMELGGKPTTIVLRFSDERLDYMSKTHYHKVLNSIITDIKLPEIREEETDESDVIYERAMNWLRVYANTNRNKYFRVYQELKEYNYWRNLCGQKKFFLFVYFVIGVIEFILNYKDTSNLKYMFQVSNLSLIVLILSIIFTIVFIRKSTVKEKAFDYAIALVEVCDDLSE